MTTIDYYNINAEAFFNTSVKADISSLYDTVLPQLKPGGHILDAGCGSGRDSKAFLEQSFTVTAIDASEELAKAASGLIGQAVEVCTFQNFQSDLRFDAIWACASLLHVPAAEQTTVFNHLASYLKPGGLFYCSYKYGDSDIARNGRSFTDANEQRLAQFLVKTTLSVKETWITNDIRPEKEHEQWLNAMLQKSE